jgi:hypothetical protein
MKKILIYLVVMTVCFYIVMPADAQQQRFQPTWESLQHYKIPEWFRDAKFGTLFQSLSSSQTSTDFINKVEENDKYNVFS